MLFRNNSYDSNIGDVFWNSDNESLKFPHNFKRSMKTWFVNLSLGSNKKKYAGKASFGGSFLNRSR
ncbi:unknown [Bacteroides sp. CAG:770]|nr:unknown [Bacteroides sp. CAG:770]